MTRVVELADVEFVLTDIGLTQADASPWKVAIAELRDRAADVPIPPGQRDQLCTCSRGCVADEHVAACPSDMRRREAGEGG
jgi:hypothetical protein